MNRSAQPRSVVASPAPAGPVPAVAPVPKRTPGRTVTACATAVALVLVAVVGSGCGSEARPAGALSRVRSAVAATADADSFRFRMEARSVPADGGDGAGGGPERPLEFGAEGEVDTRRGMGRVRMRGLSLPGDARAAEREVEVRIVPDGIYLDLAAIAPEAFGPQRWLAVDTRGLPGGDAAGIPGVARSGPGEVLDMLRGVSEDLEEMGPERVHGVVTTRYRATLDPTVALRRLPDGTPSEREDRLRELGRVRIPAEIWIDDDGLVRRFTMEVDAAQLAVPGTASRVEVTYEILAVGVPVEVAAPLPEETVSVFDALGRYLDELLEQPGVPGRRP